MSRNQFDTARQALTSALDVFQALDEPRGEALCRRDMALIARTNGDDASALELYRRSLADFDRAGDVVGRAIVLTQSAHIRMRQGETDAAQTQLDEALEIYEGVGYTGGRARTLRRVGQLLLAQGRSDLAVLTFTEVLELCRDSGDVIGEGHLLRDLGHAFAVMGRPDRARDFYDRAVAAREEIMDLSGARWCVWTSPGSSGNRGVPGNCSLRPWRSSASGGWGGNWRRRNDCSEPADAVGRS